jgi:hypothetical protein
LELSGDILEFVGQRLSGASGASPIVDAEDEFEQDKKTASVYELKFANIISRHAFFVLGERTTICILRTRSGFEIIGESHCQDARRFNEGIGELYAYLDAVKKLETFELYREQNDPDYYSEM